jgi:internalin A
MMESCGICFRVRELHRASYDNEGKWEYVAPDLLSEWSDIQELLLGRLRDDPPATVAIASYTFLHDGILRGYLSKLGQHAGDAAIYWKYGCCFYEKTTNSQVLIESKWDDVRNEAGAGKITFRGWGENANTLITLLLQALQRLPVGQPPEINRVTTAKVFTSSHATVQSRDHTSGGLERLEIIARHDLPAKTQPEMYVSFAWGDNSSGGGRQQNEIVNRLCQTLIHEGWNVLRDNSELHPGELISGFMKRIGRADHVIVILSAKYLKSIYCMTELHSIYQRSVGEEQDFLSERVAHAKHWRAEFEEMQQHFKDLGEVDFRLYKAMQDWHNRIGDMLAYVNDVPSPHGFDEIVKGNFAALRLMLMRRR